MFTERFWSSPAAWPHQRAARQTRTRHATVDEEPVAKGRRGGHAAYDFRTAACPQFAQGGRRTLTGPVALDLSFTAARKNPPAIHKIAKWALDVLGEKLTDANGTRWPALYRDDRQVKLLHVHLDQAWQPTIAQQTVRLAGQTSIEARPVRDVVNDLIVADRLSTDDNIDPWELDLDRRRDLWADVFDDHRLDDVDDERWDGDTDVDHFIRDWHTYQRRQRLQLSLLATADKVIASALCTHPEWIAGASQPKPYPAALLEADLRRQVADHEADAWMYLTSLPIIPILPRLPDAAGGHERFLADVRKHLDEYRRRLTVLTPLLVPLKITILVVPPSQGKDLDNIALDVLPIAHEVFRPHIEPSDDAPSMSGDSPDQAEARQRFRSLNAISVTSYQVIELQRPSAGPEAGMLRLALGRGDDATSAWHKTTLFVDECLRRL
jgi:hypothetical protein